MDQAIKRAFTNSNHVLFIHTGNPFTVLENRHLFTFPQSTPNLDSAILDVENLGVQQEEEEEEEVDESEKEERRRAKAFELDIEEDTNPERFRLLIK